MLDYQFFALANHLVNQWIERFQVDVVVLADNPDVIVAWVATDESEVVYVWVKPRFRRMGIGKSLGWSPGSSFEAFNYLNPSK